MDELLQRALDRRDQLRVELTAVERFIQTYAPLVERARNAPTNTDLFDSLPPVTQSKAARAKEIAAAMVVAENIILAAGRPLSRSILLRELEKAGRAVVGTDKSKVLGTNLWRSKRFLNLKGLGYWPKSVPLPALYQAALRRSSMLLTDED